MKCTYCSRGPAETKLKTRDGVTSCASLDSCAEFRHQAWIDGGRVQPKMTKAAAFAVGASGTAAASPSAKAVEKPDLATEQPERPTLDELLFGYRAAAPDIQAPQATLRTVDAARGPAKRSIDAILFGDEVAQRSADLASNADSSDSGLTPSQRRAWAALEASVDSGDDAAMCAACLEFAEAIGAA